MAIAAEAATDASTVRIPNVPKSHNVLRVLGASLAALPLPPERTLTAACLCAQPRP